MLRLITFLISLMIVTAASLHAQKRAMTTDDILNMTNLGSAIMSPDGESVIFGKSELNWKENKRETTYYHIPADSGKAFQYIGEEGGSDLMYSPNGEYLALKRTADEKSQIFLMPTSGGEAVQLTKHDTSVDDFEWSADSKIYLF